MILRILLFVLAGLLLLLLQGFAYVAWVIRIDPPKVSGPALSALERKEPSPGLFTIGKNFFRQSRSGLYELYVEGNPYERGLINGKLTGELVKLQEDYFNEQINKLVPSRTYLHFLKYFVRWFNRNLDKNVTEEYKEEIYGISQSASDRYDYIGDNYARILNYHAAHDIGHALQNLALVGCTSFGTWSDRSADGSLIIGRNFDFYVGEKFAQHKIVAFEKPSSGYRFMMVTWAGFIGVVSGMNEEGLTVTINADKSAIPFGSATPVSLVAREILQYAKNIDEALAIAKKRKMFVSESFLVGSANDHRAAIIEKTPDAVELYDPGGSEILCANHFQSNGLGHSKSNRQQIDESASAYRFRRLQELLHATGRNTVDKTAAILRDRGGLHGEDIGMGNEKALNQLIAHHSIIFEPEKRLVWVSTAPWQLGEYVCYDLNKVFSLAAAGLDSNREIGEDSLTIPADPFLNSSGFEHFLQFKQYREAIRAGGTVAVDSLIASNPHFYQTYQLAGDEYLKQKNYAQALTMYEKALQCTIPTKSEANTIRKQIDRCRKIHYF